MNPHLRFVSALTTVVRTVAAANGVGRAPHRRFVPGEVRRDVERLHVDDVEVEVTAIRRETPDTKTFKLEGVRRPLPPFVPGQYVTLAVEIDGVRTNRPLSISSPPTAAGYEVTVKQKPGGFVAPFLHEHLTVGDRLFLAGPSGDFYFNPLRDTDELVLIAAGSGISPFVGMTEHLLATRRGARIMLLYGARAEPDIIFGERLVALGERFSDRLTTVISLTQPGPGWAGERGRISGELLTRLLAKDSLERKTFFICGPEGLKATAIATLGEMGVKKSRLACEIYGGPTDVTESAGWPTEVAADQAVAVRLSSGTATIPAQSGESLMVSLERSGFKVEAACRTGTCGVCRCRLVEGEVFHGPHVNLRQSDREARYVHACAAYPLTDVEIEAPECRLRAGGQRFENR